MLEFLILILSVAFLYYGFRFIFRTQDRIEFGIKKDGMSKGLDVLYIREITRFDGINSFLKLDVLVSSF